MEPMSMPSSSEAVATTQRSSPALRARSTARRCSLETEPWWARAMTGAPSGRAWERLVSPISQDSWWRTGSAGAADGAQAGSTESARPESASTAAARAGPEDAPVSTVGSKVMSAGVGAPPAGGPANGSSLLAPPLLPKPSPAATRMAQASLRWAVRRSQAPRELTKTRVVRWASTWSRIASSMWGQMDAVI